MKLARVMKPMVRIRPGTTPAINKPPTDTLDPAIKAYTIIALLGGIIAPRFEAEAITALL